MKLADSSVEKLESFFRQYLEDETFRLPPIYFYAGAFTNFLTALISVHGITFGRRIFITPKLLFTNKDSFQTLPADLIVHETAHVLQYQREGFVGFLYKYLADYWRNLRMKEKRDAKARQQAYLEIPFEIEARAIAEKFIEWNNNRKKDTTGLE